MANERNSFLESLKTRWMSAYHITFNKSLSDQELREPKKTWLNIAQIDFLDRDFNSHTDCVLYKTPGKGQSGELKVTPKYRSGSCKEVFFNPFIGRIGTIKKFGFHFEKNRLTLMFDLFNYDIEFLNLKLKRDFSLSQVRKVQKKDDEVLVSLMELTRGRQLKNDEICYQVDDNCQATLSDTCFLCPNFVMAIKDGHCSDKYSKVCSNKKCGVRGHYACIRGEKFLGKLEDYCIVDSPIGYCLKPYRVFCENKRLVCR